MNCCCLWTVNLPSSGAGWLRRVRGPGADSEAGTGRHARPIEVCRPACSGIRWLDHSCPVVKIKRVISRLTERDMDARLWNPRMRWSTKSMLLVFVETDAGDIGVGEAWAVGASPRAVVDVIDDEVAPLLVGRDPHHVERFWQEVQATTVLSSRRGVVSAALSAVDMALWDLLAKSLDLPLYHLLGAYADDVACYASAGLYADGKTVDDLASEMAGYVAGGFDAVKMKVGGTTLEEDTARVAAVRDAVGPRVRLMVDAMYNLNVPEALRMARAFEPFDIYFFEAPVSSHDVTGQAIVNARSPIPVCGNETEFGIATFRELITRRAVEFVQFDLSICGGISEGRRIASLVSAFCMPCTMHAASTSVLLAATLHFAAATANCESVEYHMLHQWLFDLAPEGAFAVRNGRVAPPPGRGIGIELAPDSSELA